MVAVVLENFHSVLFLYRGASAMGNSVAGASPRTFCTNLPKTGTEVSLGCASTPHLVTMRSWRYPVHTATETVGV